MVDRSLHYLNEIPISELKGFGEKRVKSLHKSGIKSVTDLIRLFPKKHYDRSQIMNLSDVLPDYDKEITIFGKITDCLLYTSPSPRDLSTSRMPSSA